MIFNSNLLILYLATVSLLILGGLSLQALPALGKWTKPLSTFLTQGFGLDGAIAYFTLLPPVIGASLHGWLGLATAIGAQVTGMLAWIAIDELRHWHLWQGPKIHRTTSQLVGGWRNHLAVWITSLAIPILWLVRLGEWIIYPPLTVLVKLPAYKSTDWVNVSRQKFEGLVGYDLIWCLYCDWMTGVWSLATEMLRNVESFWCPIRFASGKKCENCKLDFPDVDSSWIAANGSMGDVTALLQDKYTGADECGWHGHPGRSQE
jgi:hypothetical protein